MNQKLQGRIDKARVAAIVETTSIGSWNPCLTIDKAYVKTVRIKVTQVQHTKQILSGMRIY